MKFKRGGGGGVEDFCCELLGSVMYLAEVEQSFLAKPQNVVKARREEKLEKRCMIVRRSVEKKTPP